MRFRLLIARMRSIAADRGFGFLPTGFSGSVTAGGWAGAGWVGGVESTGSDITAGGGGAESGISFLDFGQQYKISFKYLMVRLGLPASST